MITIKVLIIMLFRVTAGVMRRVFDNEEDYKFKRIALGRGPEQSTIALLDVPYDQGIKIIEAFENGARSRLPQGVELSPCEVLPRLLQERTPSWRGDAPGSSGRGGYGDRGSYGGGGGGYRGRGGGGSRGGGYGDRDRGSYGGPSRSSESGRGGEGSFERKPRYNR